MPSKAAQHIAFFFVLLASAGLHYYVFTNFKRLLLRDYPRLGKRLVRIAAWTFILMDSPFLFLFVRGWLSFDQTVLTRVLLYPFSIWQSVLLLWSVILVPISLWRRTRMSVDFLKRRVLQYRTTGKMALEELAEENIELEVAPE